MTNKEALQILQNADTSSPFEVMEAVIIACKALETVDRINAWKIDMKTYEAGFKRGYEKAKQEYYGEDQNEIN